eukprot:SAG11_NODE_5181_length_1638_cov_1.339181_2_plen_96_part_00
MYEDKADHHGRADFLKEKESAPADLKHLLDDVEFIPYRRREHEVQAMIDEIGRRGDVSQKILELTAAIRAGDLERLGTEGAAGAAAAVECGDRRG